MGCVTAMTDPRSVPTELRRQAQWVIWRRGPTDEHGKFRKIPHCPKSGLKADVTEPAAWTTFEEALTGCEVYHADGVGFVFTDRDPFIGVDLDNCIAEDGTIEPWAKEIVDRLHSYTEGSPSARGVKVFLQGAPPSLPGHKKAGLGAAGHGEIEIYDRDRFFTVTGRHWPGTPTSVEDCNGQFQTIIDRVFAAQNDSVVAASSMTDEELIATAKAAANGEKFSRLWTGDVADHHGDNSAADLALSKLLAFWTGGNVEQMDRLFRQSGLFREKWDETHDALGRTYGHMTIAKALEGQVEFYGASAGENAQRVLEQVRLTGNEGLAFDAAHVFASLSSSEWGKVKAELKKTLGNKLDRNDLQKAVKDLRLLKVSNQPETDNGIPIIVVNNTPLREKSATAVQALAAKNDPPRLFVRSGELVRLMSDPHQGTIKIKAVDENYLTGLVDRSAQFVRVSDSGRAPTDPPRSVILDILANVQDSWPFPPIRGIVEAPVLRADGSILDQPGYDAASSLYYHPARGLVVPTIPPIPSQHEAMSAARLILDEVLADFPFADDAGPANTLAMMLTIVLREIVDGPVPLGIATAPQAGTGKSLLDQAISVITTGRESSAVTAPSDEREWTKLIGSLLGDGANIILFDNVDNPINSPSLAAAITARQFKYRVLGESRTVYVPVQVTWIANGNNVVVGRDLPRRCFWVRLNPKHSRPHMRTGFKHPKLLNWVKDHRGRLLAALLTMARAWFVADRPPAYVQDLGSFESWTSTVGGVLAYANVPGFLSNYEEMYTQQDNEDSGWLAFLNAWHVQFGNQPVSTPELTVWLKESRDVLPDYLAGFVEDAGFQRKLGKAFSKRKECRFGNEGLHIELAGERRNLLLWRVSADRPSDQTPPPPPPPTGLYG